MTRLFFVIIHLIFCLVAFSQVKEEPLDSVAEKMIIIEGDTK